MTSTVILSLCALGVLIVLLTVLRLRRVSIQSLMFGLTGAILGLLLGALASVPLSKLPQPFGGVLPVVASVLLTFVVMALVLGQRRAILGVLSGLRPHAPIVTAPPAPDAVAETQLPQILVDTSVIIDGRIADIASAGFVPGRLVVPRFVLAELQNIADSDNAMRRGRGRRGLDVLNRLREMDDISVEIIEDDLPAIREVDAKLVGLAQRFSCNVLTTDYNLNRVAQIQGVRVLNVNELSNAIRPVVLPGEELMVTVVQPGKERNQGVGYLADGTMIVVENGDKLMGQQVSTEVTRVFQTVAGKMIFATPRKPVNTTETKHAEPVAKPAPTNNKPETSVASSVTDKEPVPERKHRFGRPKNRQSGGNNQPKPAQNADASANTNSNSGANARGNLEDRIIAATSDPTSQAKQPNDR